MKKLLFLNARRAGIGLVAAALAACLGTSANADVIPVAVSDWSDSRTETAGELVTFGSWVGDGVSISWEITFDGTYYTYVYTVDGNGSPAISHLDVAVSDGRDSTVIFTDANVFTGTDGPYEIGTFSEGSIPTDIYAFKFDFGDDPPQTYTLVTDRAPIWGSFYAKAGNNSGAYNSGWSLWGDYLADDDIPNFVFDKTEWIAVPDSDSRGAPPVPEPSSIVLAGLGLASALGVWRRRGR